MTVLLILASASLNAADKRIHRVNPGESLYALALRYDCSVEELKSLNGLDRDVLYSGEELEIPPRFADVHIVASGDTLSQIAGRYDIPQEKLISLNRLKGSALRAGQELQLIRPPFPGETWTVGSGDTLSWISLKFDISQERLKQINELDDSALKVGQELVLSSSRPQTITVGSGDSLWRLSREHGVSVENLMAWNGLSSDVLAAGEELQLFPVVLELDEADESISPALKAAPESSPAAPSEVEEPIVRPEVKLASLNLDPLLYFSNPTRRRTQPNANYSEENLDDPNANYEKALKVLKDFESAVRRLPPLSDKLTGYTVVLDPGHGGLDPGAVVSNTDGNGNTVFVVEDEYCYDISLRVYRDLIRHGAEVGLTVISPNQTIRPTPDASITYVNQKNEVYNSRRINNLNRYSVWPVGNAWGLDQRKEVAREILAGENIKKSLFVSIHADNNPGDGEGTRVLYHPSSAGTNSQDLAESLEEEMGLGSASRPQNVRVLQMNPAPAAALVEVRNLAYKNNAWAIRNEELRQDDADRIVRGIISYCKMH